MQIYRSLQVKEERNELWIKSEDWNKVINYEDRQQCSVEASVNIDNEIKVLVVLKENDIVQDLSVQFKIIWNSLKEKYLKHPSPKSYKTWTCKHIEKTKSEFRNFAQCKSK